MFITIGQIINTHGNRGELKIRPITDDASRFEELKTIYAIDPANEKKTDRMEDRRPLTIQTVRFHKNMVLITFKEIADMNQAEAVKGYYLQLPESELKPLPEGRYYIYQLEGLKVYEGDQCYGTLVEVLQPGSNDVYVVRDDQREILVPALKTVIQKVDLAAGRMDVILPPGLLD